MLLDRNDRLSGVKIKKKKILISTWEWRIHFETLKEIQFFFSILWIFSILLDFHLIKLNENRKNKNQKL